MRALSGLLSGEYKELIVPERTGDGGGRSLSIAPGFIRGRRGRRTDVMHVS